MVEETYGTTADIPGDRTTVRSGDTRAVGAAFEQSVGLVGNMDTTEGSATPDEVVSVSSSSDAATKFGEASELKTQFDLLPTSISDVKAVPLSETETTETFNGSQTDTLSNVPIFDPRLHDDHTVTVQDTAEGASVTVEYTDDTPSNNTPTDANTLLLNPNTGEWAADESSDYDITYEYGDYSSPIEKITKELPRTVGVLSENTDVADTLVTEMNNRDVNFGFMHGFVGTSPSITVNSYSDNFDERRLSVVAPPRGTTDAAQTNVERTIGAVAGKQAAADLGDTTTYESLNGFTSLGQDFTNSEVATLIDEQVYPLQQRDGVRIMKDMTTSTDTRFNRVAWSEIVDEVTELSHQIAEGFVSEANIVENRFALRESLDTTLSGLQRDNLLDAYAVSVAQDDTEDDTVNVDIGVDVVDYMDTIVTTISAGDVVTNGGVA
jgi:hypothetical protein